MPPATCRVVVCASLWPDPADPSCPSRFLEDATKTMQRFWNPLGRTDLDYENPFEIREALLDFIAEFAS